jgi:transposase
VAIVGGLDIHRGQITLEWSDDATGEVARGQIRGADRARVRRWLGQFQGQEVDLALEGCTGWRYVVEEIDRAGFGAHVAEPAEAQARRGRKKRAKTDRSDSRLLRELLVEGRLPHSWIPPAHVLEARAAIRLYNSLVDTRTEWIQRMHAVLFHHGVPVPDAELTVDRVRAQLLTTPDLSPVAHRQLGVGYRMVDHVNTELPALKADLSAFARRQRGCRAIWDAHYGVGPLSSVAIWSELGDCRRFSSSDQAVRPTGLDVTVYSSDNKRSPGRLSRQGPPTLRWALYEAGKCACRASSPDYEYYQAVKQRQGGNRAAMSVARKIVRRCYHTRRDLGEAALEPVAWSGHRRRTAPRAHDLCDQLPKIRCRVEPPSRR